MECSELRQQIYDYIYDKEIFVEILPRPLSSRFIKQELPAPVLDLSKPRSDIEVKRRRYPKPEGYVADLNFAITKLYLVNRQLHYESLDFLYRRLHLFAQSCSPLRYFFKVTPLPSLHAIGTLDLYHATYAHPELLSHEEWKQKADAAWANTLAAVVTHMPNIRRLRISVEIRDVPFALRIDAPWAKLLLALSDLRHLDAVTVRVESLMLRNQRLFLRRFERAELPLATRNYAARRRVEHGDCLAEHEGFGAEVARRIVGNDEGVVWDRERSERWRALSLDR